MASVWVDVVAVAASGAAAVAWAVVVAWTWSAWSADVAAWLSNGD